MQHSLLEFLLLDAKLPGQLVKSLFVVAGHLGGAPQTLVQLLQGDLITHALTLHNLDLLEDLIRILGGDGKLGDSVGQVCLGLLGLLLHQHDPPGQGGDVRLNFHEQLPLLLETLHSGVDLVHSVLVGDLHVVNFLAKVPDVALGLAEDLVGLLSGLFKLADDAVKSLGFILEGLHFLSNGIHVDKIVNYLMILCSRLISD